MKLIGLYNHLLESKASEALGLNVLTKANIMDGESIIQQFVIGDKSQKQKNIPIMSYLYASGYDDIGNIISVVNEYNDLEVMRRVKPVQLTKNGIVMGDKKFTDFFVFSEYIHGETNNYSKKDKGNSNVSNDFNIKHKPMLTGDGIEVYEADNVAKSVSYTQGGLTGKAYGFCIGQPSNSMYKSYRDSKTSSFYFIIDRNHYKTNEDGSINLDDPLHIVVFDNTKNGVELTDANNTTGRIAEYGKDVNGYVNYLKSKGIEVEKMVNKPKTEQERIEDELLGRQNTNLAWFKGLPIEYKSAYIGRGHRLTDDQFDYLIGR